MHLREGRWYVKCSQCEIFLLEAEFLGHRIMANGVRMVLGKVEAVATWPIPTCERLFLKHSTKN